jgi:protease I
LTRQSHNFYDQTKILKGVVMTAVKGMKVILVVAHTGFQQVEYSVPKQLLEEHGVIVITASDEDGGALAKDEKTIAHVDITLDKITMKDYQGIFFIGGPGAMDHLDNPKSQFLISEAKRLKIPYGAICISVRILAKAWALKGIRATGWDEDKALRGILEGFGAIYDSSKDVVIDDIVVTAVGPSVAKKFGQAILQVLRIEKLSPKKD